jgi:hypothetical protein
MSHLSADHGHRSCAKDGSTLQNREDTGGGGSTGLQNGEDKEKGAMRAAHRRWKVCAAAMLGGGGWRRWLRKPAVIVGGEGRWHRLESEERLAVGDRCGGG